MIEWVNSATSHYDTQSLEQNQSYTFISRAQVLDHVSRGQAPGTGLLSKFRFWNKAYEAQVLNNLLPFEART